MRVLAVPTDMRDTASVKAAAAAAADRFGTVHILVNNAGGPIKRQERQITWPDTDWQDDVNIKTIGMLRMIQALLPSMPTDGTGRIINISGIAGSSVLSSALTHGLNNSAMNQVTTYLAKDLGPSRITVNSVIPGLIATEWRESWAEAQAKLRGVSKQQFLDDVCREWGIVSGPLGDDGRGDRPGGLPRVRPGQLRERRSHSRGRRLYDQRARLRRATSYEADLQVRLPGERLMATTSTPRRPASPSPTPSCSARPATSTARG